MTRDKLRTAAQAVIDRWETPKWKDAPATAEYIAALRNALAAEQAAAGQEPVATDGWLHENGLLYRLTDERHPCNRDEINVTMADGSRSVEARSRRALELLDRIRVAPQPAVAAGWVMLPGQLPEPGKPVLLDIGKKFPIRAMWAAKHTLPVGTEDDSGFGEYDEEKDEWFCPEGWYEWNKNEETHWAVNQTPRAWCELPQPIPPAPSTEGESNG